MRVYYDTGILLKLYTEETQSPLVWAYVTAAGEPILVNDFHLAECASALRLKQFRGECEAKQAARALYFLEADIRAGMLRRSSLDWEEAWRECRSLANCHAGATGCRTLDTLHVACARGAHATAFVTSDRRQTALAELVGMPVINPFEET